MVLGGFGKVFGRVWGPFGRSRGHPRLFFSCFGTFLGCLAIFSMFLVNFWLFLLFLVTLSCCGMFLLNVACWAWFFNCVGRAKRASKASERSSLVLALGFPCLPMLSLAYPCFHLSCIPLLCLLCSCLLWHFLTWCYMLRQVLYVYALPVHLLRQVFFGSDSNYFFGAFLNIVFDTIFLGFWRGFGGVLEGFGRPKRVSKSIFWVFFGVCFSSLNFCTFFCFVWMFFRRSKPWFCCSRAGETLIFTKSRFSHLIATRFKHGSKNRWILRGKIKKNVPTTLLKTMLFSIAFFHGFWKGSGKVLEGFWRGLGGFGGYQKRRKIGPFSDFDKKLDFCGFWKDLGRVWGGFWQASGRVWEGFGMGLEGFGRIWLGLAVLGWLWIDFSCIFQHYYAFSYVFWIFWSFRVCDVSRSLCCGNPGAHPQTAAFDAWRAAAAAISGVAPRIAAAKQVPVRCVTSSCWLLCRNPGVHPQIAAGTVCHASRSLSSEASGASPTILAAPSFRWLSLILACSCLLPPAGCCFCQLLGAVFAAGCCACVC